MLDATRLRVLVAIARHGSVTAAAAALNYAQPSISHHMARLEAETGAKLMERSGRGVRLTEAGQLLAGRAEEILGRLDAAEAELAAHVGLRQERVRVAAFGSALGTLVAAAGAALPSALWAPPAARTATTTRRAKATQPRGDLDIVVRQAEPAEALHLLRIGEADVAVVFRYMTQEDGDQDWSWPDGSAGGGGLRMQCLLDEPVYLLTRGSVPRPRAGEAPRPALADYSGGRWIAGCEQCRTVLVRLCAQVGFSPDIAVSTDDYLAVQALVAAGFGTAVLPGLAIRSPRHPGVQATALPGVRRQVLAASYENAAGSASDRLVEALADAARSLPPPALHDQVEKAQP